MIETNSSIDRHIQDNLPSAIDELIQLCAQPSISATDLGIEDCANLVEAMLSKRGFQVQRPRTPGKPVILAHLSGKSDRTLLFYNHYDVQPPEPLDLWTSPPFEPTLRDGSLYARGAEDDKGEFVARLAAVDAVLAANNGQLPCNVIFVVEGEEEIGSPHIANFVQEHKQLLSCDGSVWEGGGVDPEDRPLVTTGFRGVLGVKLSVRTMKRDGHSGGAHYLPSAAWRLLRALESLKGPDEVIRVKGFYDKVLSPSNLDLELLNQLPEVDSILRQNLDIDQFVAGRRGQEIHRSVFQPTCNIQGITTGYQGGGMKTVIPAEARASLDFRLVPNQDPDEIFALLQDHFRQNGFSDIELECMGSMWPAKVPADDPLVQLTVDTAAEVYEKRALVDPLAGGSSPVYAFARPLGDIPVVTAGTGYSENRIHAPDEHVRISDFQRGIRHLARILNKFDTLS